MINIHLDKKALQHVLLILAVVLVAYANAFQNTFVYDDLDLVVKNIRIRDWSDIPGLFTTGYWASLGKSGGLYRPLTMLTFLVEYSIAGLNPLIYHLDNIALHSICSVLVYFIAGTFIKDRKAPLFVALLFAVHPVHVEAVSWVSGRAELLGAVFSLCSTLIFIRRPSGTRYIILSCLFFMLALLSKESAAAMPMLLGVYLLLFEEPGPGQGRLKHLALRLYPLFIIFLVYLVPRLFVLGGVFGPASADRTFYGVSPYHIALTMSRAFYEYMRLGLLPFGLTVDYVFPPPSSFLEFKVVAPIAALGLTLILAGRIIRLSSPAFYGILWFFIALLPVSNIIPIGIIMSERAMYIPSAGMCIVLGVAFSKAGIMADKPQARKLPYAAILLVAAAIFFVAGTANRNMTWRDEMSLWTDTIKKSPGSAIGHANLGAVLADEGRLDEAIAEYRKALKLSPDNPDIYIIAGPAYEAKGMTDEAIELYRTAVSLTPGSAIAHNNLGFAYSNKGWTGKAIEEYKLALRCDPDSPSAHYNLGKAYAEKGLRDEAVSHLLTALKLRPADADAHNSLGIIYAEEGLKEKAVENFEAAVRLKPGVPAFKNNLSRALEMK